jgi:hypothetical protein
VEYNAMIGDAKEEYLIILGNGHIGLISIKEVSAARMIV